VTLFARDLLDVKRIVTDMRYDEVSSRYGEFGSFYTGIRRSADELSASLRPIPPSGPCSIVYPCSVLLYLKWNKAPETHIRYPPRFRAPFHGATTTWQRR